MRWSAWLRGRTQAPVRDQLERPSGGTAPATPAPGQVVLARRGRSTAAMPATVLEVFDGSVLVEFQHVPVVQVVPLAEIEEEQ